MANKVIIIGAGIGGLAAALALLRKGIDVEVYERAPALGEVGAGVQVTPNGAKVLMDLGLESAMLERGTVSKGKDTYLWNTGQKRPFIALGGNAADQFGAPYLTFHRADLHRMLQDAVQNAKPNAIFLNHEFERLEQLDSGVRVYFSGDRSAQADVVIGADGIHSRVRGQLFGIDKPQFTGCVAWRGLIPAEAIEATTNLSGGSMWLGPTAHIVAYPVRQGKLLNFIGMVDRDDWQVESWTERGTTQECLNDFQGWHPHVQHMVRHIETPFKWALMVRPPLEQWSKDCVTLLGDACHSTLPFLSQGANMAIEDSLVLARCLAATPEDPSHALRVYDAMRRPRTARIVNSSAEQLRRVHNPELADPEIAKAYIEREWSAASVDERYRWIYGYDARTVPLEIPNEVAAT